MAQAKHMRSQSGIGTTSPQVRELRRCQDTLAICGPVIIIFGLWNLVKGLLLSSFGANSTDSPELFEAYINSLSDEQLVLVASLFLGGIFAFMAFDFILRIYVGRAAYSEGKGIRRHGRSLIAPAIVLAAGNIAFMTFAAVLTLAFSTAHPVVVLLGMVGSWLIDLASLLALFDVIRAASQAKRLRAELEGR